MSLCWPGAESLTLSTLRSCTELVSSPRLPITSVGFGASLVCFSLQWSSGGITAINWQKAEPELALEDPEDASAAVL